MDSIAAVQPLQPLAQPDYSILVLLFIIFAAVSAVWSRKITAFSGCCFGIIVFPAVFCFMVMYALIVYYLMIVFPVDVVFCFMIILGLVVSLIPQTAELHDIESGRVLVIGTPLGRPVVNVPTTGPQTRARYVAFSYRMDKKSEICSGDQCVVCLEMFEEDHKCAMLNCRHVFHRECIDMWFAVPEKEHCPICRRHVY